MGYVELGLWVGRASVPGRHTVAVESSRARAAGPRPWELLEPDELSTAAVWTFQPVAGPGRGFTRGLRDGLA